MAKIIFTVLVFFVGLSGCSTSSFQEENEKPYIILMGGQSNMVGQGKTAEIENKDVPGNFKFFNVKKRTRFTKLLKRFGPEVGVWNKLSNEFPDKDFIIIKYAIGGSSMFDWSADYDEEKAEITGHPEYGNMFETFVQNIDSIIDREESQFLALLWMQGERDAKIPEAAKEYHKNFSSFIAAIREMTSTKKLPVVYGLVNPDPNKYPALEEVQTAQRKIAEELEDVFLIETSELDKWDDNVHYSTSGQLDLGDKFGKKLLQIIQDESQNPD